jgi:uncharacterized membrane protein
LTLGALFPVLLAVHIVLALTLFLPSLLLPFALRVRGPLSEGRPGYVVRSLLWLQSTGSLIVGAGLALTGLGLLAVLGPQLLGQPWLLVALLIYAANLALAMFIQRPGLRRLLGMRSDASDEERERWRARARRQRYVSYVMATAVGVIAFLMSTKPTF